MYFKLLKNIFCLDLNPIPKNCLYFHFVLISFIKAIISQSFVMNH